MAGPLSASTTTGPRSSNQRRRSDDLLGHSLGHSTSRYSARHEHTGWTAHATSAAWRARSSTPWTIRSCLVTCCHARIALLRPSLLPLPAAAFAMVAPPRRGRANSLPRAGGLARVMAGTAWPPLPGRGLRGSSAATGRGQPPRRLTGSRWGAPARSCGHSCTRNSGSREPTTRARVVAIRADLGRPMVRVGRATATMASRLVPSTSRRIGGTSFRLGETDGRVGDLLGGAAV
jgi:hypothetical protein